MRQHANLRGYFAKYGNINSFFFKVLEQNVIQTNFQSLIPINRFLVIRLQNAGGRQSVRNISVLHEQENAEKDDVYFSD